MARRRALDGRDLRPAHHRTPRKLFFSHVINLPSSTRTMEAKIKKRKSGRIYNLNGPETHNNKRKSFGRKEKEKTMKRQQVGHGSRSGKSRMPAHTHHVCSFCPAFFFS